MMYSIALILGVQPSDEILSGHPDDSCPMVQDVVSPWVCSKLQERAECEKGTPALLGHELEVPQPHLLTPYCPELSLTSPTTAQHRRPHFYQKAVEKRYWGTRQSLFISIFTRKLFV